MTDWALVIESEKQNARLLLHEQNTEFLCISVWMLHLSAFDTRLSQRVLCNHARSS